MSLPEQYDQITPAADVELDPVSGAANTDARGAGDQLEVGVDVEVGPCAHAWSRVRIRSVPLTRQMACDALASAELGTAISRPSAS